MKNRLIFLVAAAATTLALGGCTADPDSSSSAPSTATGSPAVEAQELDSTLQSELPESIRTAGTLASVNTGAFPPYQIIASDGSVTGASADFQTAIGQLLGLKITDETVNSTAAVLTGMQGGRYELAFGPFGDLPARQEQATFVDWVQEHVVFAVPKGNPADIGDLSTTCGKDIGVQAATSAETVITAQSDTCVSEGKPAVNILAFQDGPAAILAVQAGRASAFFSSQAPLTYYVQQSNDELELAGVGSDNGFGDLLQGAIVPKDSELAPVLLKAIQKLQENGTYGAIMEKWGLDQNELETPGINLAKS